MDLNDSFFESLNIANFYTKLTFAGDTEPGLTFAQSMGLIPFFQTTNFFYECFLTNNCDGELVVINCSSSKLGKIFRCNKCRAKVSPTKDTWFFNSKLSIMENLFCVFVWCSKTHKQLSEITEILGITDKPIIKINKLLRAIAKKKVEDDHEMLGGPDVIVEIDESMIWRRKNNVGRLSANQAKQVWIVGGVERGGNKCFFEMVEKRDKTTLNSIIQKWVLPKTTIYTDCWRGYHDLNSLGYKHESVNHSQNFINPANSSCHTQSVERFWRSVKENLPKQSHEELREGYLDEFAYKYRYLKDKSTGIRFKLVLELIAYYHKPLMYLHLKQRIN